MRRWWSASFITTARSEESGRVRRPALRRARGALSALHAAGLRIAVVTNKQRRFADSLLHLLGLHGVGRRRRRRRYLRAPQARSAAALTPAKRSASGGGRAHGGRLDQRRAGGARRRDSGVVRAARLQRGRGSAHAAVRRLRSSISAICPACCSGGGRRDAAEAVMAAEARHDRIGGAAFTLKGTDGRLHTLRELAGARGTVVAFICNRCPYVKAILPRLTRNARELAAIGVNVIGINSNDADAYPEDSFERMVELAPGLSFPYLYDEQQGGGTRLRRGVHAGFLRLRAGLELRYRGRLTPRAAGRGGGPAAGPVASPRRNHRDSDARPRRRRRSRTDAPSDCRRRSRTASCFAIDAVRSPPGAPR